MIDVRPVKKEMLVSPINLQVNQDLDFLEARTLADRQARRISPESKLLAWFDKKSWKHMPQISYGCQEKPSWLVYAQNRGGTITVDINDEEFVFIYRGQSLYP
jgi:hypothetical protein